MRTERRVGVALLAALGLAVCCGLPVLLSLGAGVTLAGVGLRSWVVIGAGLVVAGTGAWRWRHRSRASRRAVYRGRD